MPRSPPMRNQVRLHALEFPAGGGCSVWFIPVYSCFALCCRWLNGRACGHTHTHGARAHIHASCLWQLSKDIGTHTGRQTGSRDAGWSGASAEVAGSWSSAGSTGDICRKSEIQTITEEMRKWLEVMFFLPTGCVPSAALYYVFYCTDVLS